MKKLRNIALAVAVAALAALPFAGMFATKAVYAVDAKGQICEGLGGSGGSNCQVSGAPSLDATIERVVNIFSLIAGVIAVFMIIYGGFRYVTSGGDSGNISAAKNTIIYAVIGLIVIAVAQFIVKFVLDKVL